MKFVDANIFLRYLTNDDPRKARACFDFFQRLSRGEETAITLAPVIAEVAYVLTSPRQYGLSHADAAMRIRPLIEVRGLRIESKPVILEGLAIFGDSDVLDIEDALSVAFMQSRGLVEILSYDRDFDRVEGITCVEP